MQQILAKIRKGQASGSAYVTTDPLSAAGKVYLDPIWDLLKEHQKTILRTMAEMVKPEPLDRLQEYLAGKMFSAQSIRHAKTLINLNLIVVKPRDGASEILDLHPIVSKYIRDRFQRSEQAPYSNAIILVLDGFIAKFRVLLERNPTYETFEYWTQKAELSAYRGDFDAALNTLSDIERHILASYPEEYIRVARGIFDAMDWAVYFSKGGEADDVFDTFIAVLVQFGEQEVVEEYLARYEQVIPGKSSQYVNLCNLRCYQYWYAKNFGKAIEWGKEGMQLKSSTGADIRFSCDHNYSLAQRDSGCFEEAMAYFVKGSSMDKVLDPKKMHDDDDYSFYGNIGRCLEFLGRLPDALICYRKSAVLLERGRQGAGHRLNKGYVRQWVGDVLRKQEKIKEALLCYRTAHYIWSQVSPPRAKELEHAMAEIAKEYPGLVVELDNIEEGELEAEFKRWIHGREMRVA